MMHSEGSQEGRMKEEVVSVHTNLEVISEESFQRRLQGMSQVTTDRCQDCLKERARQQRSKKSRRSQRQARSKQNSPIVIRLQDTIKVSVRGRGKTRALELDSSESSSDDGLSDSQRAIMQAHPHQLKNCSVLEHFCYDPSPPGSSDNISALISALEKAHSKDRVDVRANYDNLQEFVFSTKDKSKGVLNNHRFGHRHRSQGSPQRKRRGLEIFSEADNVDLICNDLTSSKFCHVDSFDDSENSSTISSSESYAESDNSSSDSLPEELCAEELDHLTQYTSGFPVTRYDCPPHECPECVSGWYNYWNYVCTSFPYYYPERPSVCPWCDEQQCECRVPGSSRSSDNDDEEKVCSKFKVITVAPGKVDVYIGNLQEETQKGQNRSPSFLNDGNSVYVDLGEIMDVDLDVFYHSENGSHVHNNSPEWMYGNTSNFVYYPPYPVFYPPFSIPVPAYPFAAMPFMPIPKPICVPRDTKCLSSQRLCMVPANEVKNFTASQPPQRPWIPLAHPERSRPIAMYTVMCYNVLCDKYATRQLYGYCPTWGLSWEYRKKGIIEEIRHYSADIISLQEVETDQFFNFFLPELKRDGYEGIFSPKSRARTMTEIDRKHVDGCAIFFRTSKFSLVKEHLIEFNQLAMANAEGSDDMLNRVMTKDNIGLAALLETKEAIWQNGVPPEGQQRQPILVVTCHIHWDPEYSDVKLVQTMMLMAEIKSLIETTSTNLRPGASNPDANSIPMILCGDLNSLPDSGVLEYLMMGKVSANHEDFKEIGYDECLKKLLSITTDNQDTFMHPFRLAQAYSKEVMPFTNYTFDFKGIIDYIFFSRDWMTPLGVLGPLDQEWFTENKILGCPHPHIPSDHLPLLVELEMQVPSTSSPPTGRSTNSVHMGRR